MVFLDREVQFVSFLLTRSWRWWTQWSEVLP